MVISVFFFFFPGGTNTWEPLSVVVCNGKINRVLNLKQYILCLVRVSLQINGCKKQETILYFFIWTWNFAFSSAAMFIT